MRKARRLLLTLMLAIGLPVVAVIAAWLVDTARSEGHVPRNVTLAGRDVSGADRPRLEGEVRSIAADYSAASFTVGTKDRSFSASSSDTGLRVDIDATVDAALAVRSHGSPVNRLLSWVRSFVVDTKAPVRAYVDESAVDWLVQARDPGPRIEALEPGFRVDDGRLAGTDGRNGKGLPAETVRSAIEKAAAQKRPVRVVIDTEEIAPRFDTEAANALAANVEQQLLSQPVEVVAKGKSATLTPEQLRPWLRTTVHGGKLTSAFDAALVSDGLRQALPDSKTTTVQATYTITGGTPVYVAGTTGARCCAPDSAERLASRLSQNAGSPASPSTPPTSSALDLALAPVPPKVTPDRALVLGVSQEIESQTTFHPGGQPRVQNIHRIADLIRGQIVLPGETFSINEFVGPRTTAKGFVVDGVIINGKFEKSVGGGISQFATTLFNAGFFGGLDFGEYQSHSIYISRYPYGREATVSYPHPDMQLKNTTPYGVVLWPEYTETSITVKLYSTDYAQGAQTGQTKTPSGVCTRVDTQRTRTYVDGRTAVDSVRALYQPAEGVRC